MEWFRTYHGAFCDSKWSVISRKSGQPKGHVYAIWMALLDRASQAEDSRIRFVFTFPCCWALLDRASQAEDRGDISGVDPEEIDAVFDFEEGVSASVLAAMESKGMIVDGRLASWEKRQPEREDNSTDRVRRYRDRLRMETDVTPCNADETPCNAMKRHVTQCDAPDKRRLDKIREEKNKSLKASCAEPGKASGSTLEASEPHETLDCVNSVQTAKRPEQDAFEESEALFRIPCMGSPTKDCPVSSKLLVQLQTAYPAIDVPAEMLKAVAWCIANPNRQKTPQGVPRFLNSWMSKAKPAPWQQQWGGQPQRGRFMTKDEIIEDNFQRQIAAIDEQFGVPEEERGVPKWDWGVYAR
jgi:hypothetical protein